MISFTAAGAETVKLAVFSAGVPFAIAFTVYWYDGFRQDIVVVDIFLNRENRHVLAIS